MLFCQDNRGALRAENPYLKPHDIARRFGELWKLAPESERAVRVHASRNQPLSFSDAVHITCGAGRDVRWKTAVQSAPLGAESGV